MNDWVSTGLALAVMGGLLAWTAVYSTRRDYDYKKMPGLRTPKTLRSHECWLSAHRRISPILWRTGLSGLVLSCATLVWGATFSHGRGDLFLIGVMILFVPVVVHIYRIGSKAADEVAEEEER